MFMSPLSMMPYCGTVEECQLIKLLQKSLLDGNNIDYTSNYWIFGSKVYYFDHSKQ